MSAFAAILLMAVPGGIAAASAQSLTEALARGLPHQPAAAGATGIAAGDR
jgi:hypothetical protein